MATNKFAHENKIYATLRSMNKKHAIELISSGNATKAARELGITRQTLRNWPEELDQQKEDLVNGVLLRIERRRQSLMKHGK
jgi:DNA invertase Pin-like site-specific DNA recombinase